MKLHKGDTVVVISGKYKGKSGTIERVFPSEGRVIVTGVNMRTRHIPKTANQPGRKITFEASISVSKLMLVDAKTGKPSRVGFRMKDGKKQRVSKLSGEVVTKAAKSKAPKKAKTTAKKDAEAPAITSPVPAAKKQPFWKRSRAAGDQQADIGETPRMEQDHTIPDQQLHVRKGGRGS